MRIEDLNNERIGICVSGGLDSKTVTTRLLEDGLDVLCFSADLGQPDEEDINDIDDRDLELNEEDSKTVTSIIENDLDLPTTNTNLSLLPVVSVAPQIAAQESPSDTTIDSHLSRKRKGGLKTPWRSYSTTVRARQES